MLVRQAVKVAIGSFLVVAFLWAFVFMMIAGVRDRDLARRRWQVRPGVNASG